MWICSHFIIQFHCKYVLFELRKFFTMNKQKQHSLILVYFCGLNDLMVTIYKKKKMFWEAPTTPVFLYMRLSCQKASTDYKKIIMQYTDPFLCIICISIIFHCVTFLRKPHIFSLPVWNFYPIQKGFTQNLKIVYSTCLKYRSVMF